MTIKLPTFTFILGPAGCGKKTLQRLLCDQDSTLAPASFDEPIREATLQLFFPEQLHTGIDLRDPAVLKNGLPMAPAMPIYEWMDLLRANLRSISPQLIGDMAKKRVMHLDRAFDRAIFDDAQRTDDIRPFVNAFGSQSCRLFVIERPGFPIAKILASFKDTFLPTTIVANSGPPTDMVRIIKAILGETTGGEESVTISAL